MLGRTFRGTKQEFVASIRQAGLDNKTVTSGKMGHKEFFELFGFSAGLITTLDTNSYEGAEIILDLNLPLAKPLANRFNYIFDGGTLEHIFDLPQALVNLTRFCEVGGIIMHCVPVDWQRHGFVNFTPEYFRSFYLNHGYAEVKSCYLVAAEDEKEADRSYRQVPEAEYEYVFRPRYRTELLAAYKKVEESVPYKPPQQGRYVRIWNGASAEAPSSDSKNNSRSLARRFLSKLVSPFRNIGAVNELLRVLNQRSRGTKYTLTD